MSDIVERIEGKIDRDVAGGMRLAKTGSGFSIVPQNVGEALELAKVLSTAKGMIPEHLLGNPGACADVVFQALAWGMNPFALAKMSYIAQRGGAPSYMSQAISAAINASPQLDGRLRLKFEGQGEDSICEVSGRFVGEDEPHVYRSPRVKDITPRNSPLWKTDPSRQLGYWAQRAWARLYAGDILMGVYDADEITPEMAKDVTPPVDPFAGEGPKQITAAAPLPMAAVNSGAVEQESPAPVSSAGGA